MSKGQTGFVYGDRYLSHDPGPEHPERPERLTAIIKALDESLLRKKLIAIEPAPAEMKWIERVHDKAHVNRVREACESAPISLDGDTTISRESFEAACLAAGGVLQAVDAVIEGKARNAFCAVRPPGHHATRDRAMGFCLFNNVAVAARYIRDGHQLSRVLIIDWDAHHGNGTQDAFYDDPNVFYFSTHQSPCYPGSGATSERGEGAGIGFTANVPMAPGSGDAEYLKAFEEILLPAADRFKPDFVLISAGFDAHEGDPITNLNVTTEGFGRMTGMVKGIAEKHCDGRLVSVLEGGYGLKNLGDSVVAHVKELMK
jgi:acetoin utilization deacetylase AcuC-like enzyme